MWEQLIKISFCRNKETKKEHHASVLFKIGDNSLKGTARLEIYDVKKK